ncbi:2'-5' RNA ligase family protein [Sulfobacillus sp. hq2]|uniref:2'-5' RNA ligase n=1 Tax=Sulfobacillus thermotolerans TaxID=338644 RepID=A0ABM6RQV9_9FIRM|nr:2'-5' RNA ligase family protein [Sulfobacillus sp. hq2]AUW93790.1 hypothetical protein BXT84_07410 [Sulfobacillus thermotolerans]MCY0909308.1 2'-5' RNA ligase family protein [Sulfobacillus thermotolerans]
MLIDGNALIIPVALPDALEAFRLQSDPSARQLPAHVTVHFPFADEPKSRIVAPQLKRLLGKMAPFRIYFDNMGRFEMPNEMILYLKVTVTPELMTLFETIWQKFRTYPPYEGKHQEIIPHITMARVNPATAGAVEARLTHLVEQHRSALFWDISEVEWVNVQQGVPGCRILGSFPLGRSIKS